MVGVLIEVAVRDVVMRPTDHAAKAAEIAFDNADDVHTYSPTPLLPYSPTPLLPHCPTPLPLRPIPHRLALLVLGEEICRADA